MFIPEREKPQNRMIDILNADSKIFIDTVDSQ